MNKRNVLFAFSAMLVLLAFAFVTTSLFAQSIVSGEVSGTLTDPSGAVVPGATVTIKNLDTGATANATTNGTGAYRFQFLPPGSYQISISQSGFQTVTRKVQVSVGQSTRSDVRLAVGQSSQTVEVTAETPIIQTDNGNTQTSYNAAQIEALPSPGGDITYVAQQSPGVILNASSGGGYGNFTSNGTPATANLFTVNGNDNMDPFLNLNNSGASNLTLGSNELSEATVTTNGYTGEFGRNAGAQVNYATKSGTNNFHGNATYSYSGAALNARDWFSEPGQANPNSQQHQWAASVGGPIWKDRTFFFVDTEGLRYKLPTSQEAFIPSQAYENATLALIPAAEIPFYQNMFNLWNSAPHGAPLTAVDPNTNSFRSLATNTAHEWILSGRVDHQFTASDRVFFRYKTDHGLQPTYTDPISPVFNAESVQPSYEGQANWSHSFGNAVVNQFIASGSYYSAIFKPVDQAAAKAAFPYAMVSANYTGLGGINYAFPQGRNATQYQFVDDLSVTSGNHNLKFGGNFRRNDLSDYVYSERNSVTGFPLVRFLSDAAFQSGTWDLYSERFPNRSSQPFAFASLGLYAQDTWKVSSRLTVTMALRGDHNSNPKCVTNCFAYPSAQFNSTLNHDINTPYSSAIVTGQQNAFRNIEAVAWQPRLGFALTPFGGNSTAIRGGVGVFSDLFPGVFAEFFSRNVPNVNAFNIGGGLADPTQPNSAQAQAAAINTAFLGAYNSGGTFTGISNTLLAQGVTFRPPTLNAISDNVKNPKYIKWNLEFEQALGSKTNISLNYNGNHGRDIFITNNGINAYCDVAHCGSTFAGLPTAPLDPRFGVVTYYYNGGVSNYNGLTASVNRRYSQVQFTAAYTWSHNLDDVSNGGINPYSLNDSLLGQINPSSLHSLNYGNADYDARHSFTGSYSWTPGWKFGQGFLNNTLGGWTLSQTFNYRSGLPFSVYDSNLTNPGIPNYGASMLVNVLGGPTSCGAPSSLSAPACLSDTNFADPTGFATINQRRNQFRGPGFFDTDMTISKLFKINERVGFGLGATAFNLLNHPNFANPVNDFASVGAGFGSVQSTVAPPTSPFGAFAGAASGRIVQVTGRLNF